MRDTSCGICHPQERCAGIEEKFQKVLLMPGRPDEDRLRPEPSNPASQNAIRAGSK